VTWIAVVAMTLFPLAPRKGSAKPISSAVF
jgi:hypothetical protein